MSKGVLIGLLLLLLVLWFISKATGGHLLDTSGRFGIHTDPATGQTYYGPYSPEQARAMGLIK